MPPSLTILGKKKKKINFQYETLGKVSIKNKIESYGIFT